MHKTSEQMTAETDFDMLPCWLKNEKRQYALVLYAKYSRPLLDMLSMIPFGAPMLIYEDRDEHFGKARYRIVYLEFPAEAHRKVQLRQQLAELRQRCFEAAGIPSDQN